MAWVLAGAQDAPALWPWELRPWTLTSCLRHTQTLDAQEGSRRGGGGGEGAPSWAWRARAKCVCTHIPSASLTEAPSSGCDLVAAVPPALGGVCGHRGHQAWSGSTQARPVGPSQPSCLALRGDMRALPSFLRRVWWAPLCEARGQQGTQGPESSVTDTVGQENRPARARPGASRRGAGDGRGEEDGRISTATTLTPTGPGDQAL